MDGKKWWQSKTMWFNLLAGAGAVVDQVAATGMGGPYLVPAVAAINLFLRSITAAPLR